MVRIKNSRNQSSQFEDSDVKVIKVVTFHLNPAVNEASQLWFS